MPTTDFALELQYKMAKFAYTPPQHRSSEVYIPHHLQECEFDFVRNDTIRRPLTPTYTGPLKVLNRADKHITIKRGKNRGTVSIDRVKPAFIEKADPSTDSPSDISADSSEPSPKVQLYTTAPTRKQTKFGWKAIFPRNFKSYIYF